MPGQKSKGGGGGGGAGMIRAGGAFFELHVRDNITGALDKIQKRIAGFGSILSKVGIGSLKGGAALAAGPLGLLLNGGARLADTAKMAKALDIPIQKMAAFKHAAEQAGVTVEEVMNDTTGKFQELIQGAPLIDPMEAQAALSIQKDFKDSIRALENALTPLLKILAPAVTEVAKFAKENAGLIQIVGGVAAGLLAFGAALSLIGPVFTVLGVGAGVLSAAIGFILSPIGLVTVAFGSLIAYFATQTQQGKETVKALGETFRDMGKTFSDTFGGIVDAVKGGDLELAFKIAGVGIKTVWAGVMLALRQGWNGFMQWTIDSLRRNPWILPLIGGVVGGLTGGPAGALAGAGAGLVGAAGLEVFGDDIANALRGDEAGAKGRLGELKRELAELRGKAAVKAADAAAGKDPFVSPGGGPKPDAAKLFDAVKGLFTIASGRQQFGYGDKVAVQTNIQRAIQAGVEDAAKELKEINGNLRLK